MIIGPPKTDYLGLGLTTDHIPELIRLSLEWSLDWWERTDETESLGPVHAWHALGALQAEAAIDPLVTVMKRTDEMDDDWSMEDLPGVFAQIGPAAIPALSAALADPSTGLWARVTATNGLEQIGREHQNAREDCVAALSQVLTRFAEHDPGLNASLISSLVDLEAADAAPLMEQAFAADAVDIAVRGDWEDVQIDLGLLEERQTPKPNYFGDTVLGEPFLKLRELSQAPRPKPEPTTSRAQKAKKKAKRKRQKAARRRQRKRK